MMLVIEGKSMRQSKLAQFRPFATHSANKAPFWRELMDVVVCRAYPNLVLVVDRDGQRPRHVLVAAKMARPHFVIAPGEQKGAVGLEFLHATDRSLGRVQVIMTVEGQKVRSTATPFRR